MTTPKRPDRKQPGLLKHSDHARLWGLVEGAVVDAFRAHPEYLTDRGSKAVVYSVTKRVVGQIVGHAKQTLRGSRLGDCRREGDVSSPHASPEFATVLGGAVILCDRPNLQTPVAPFGDGK